MTLITPEWSVDKGNMANLMAAYAKGLLFVAEIVSYAEKFNPANFIGFTYPTYLNYSFSLVNIEFTFLSPIDFTLSIYATFEGIGSVLFSKNAVTDNAPVAVFVPFINNSYFAPYT